MSVWISVSRAWGAVSSGNGREFDAFDEDELLDVLVDYHTGGDRVPDDAPPLWLRAGHHSRRRNRTSATRDGLSPAHAGSPVVLIVRRPWVVPLWINGGADGRGPRWQQPNLRCDYRGCGVSRAESG